MIGKKIKSFLKNERGMALATVLVVSTALALVGSSYLSTTTQEASLLTDEIQDKQALYLAESGIQYARRQLVTYTNWENNPSWAYGKPADGLGGELTISFTYNVANDPPGVITSTSNYQGHSKTIVAGVSPTQDDPFNQGGCGCDGLTLSNNSVTGSYEYEGVTYTSGTQGDVASNGDLDLAKAFVGGNVGTAGNLYGMGGNGGCRITGSATAKLSVDSDLTGGEGGNIEGGITLDSTFENPCNCDAINLPNLQDNAGTTNNNSALSSYLSGAYSTDFAATTNGETVTIPGGVYYFTSFSVANNVTINIDASESNPVIIFFADNYPDDNPATGTFNVSNNVTINSDDKTNQLKIYSDLTGTIEMDQNVTFSGSIYAPDATINLKQNVVVNGAVLGGYTNMLNNSILRYDSGLTDVLLPGQVPPTEVTVTINSWSQG